MAAAVRIRVILVLVTVAVLMVACAGNGPLAIVPVCAPAALSLADILSAVPAGKMR